MTEDEARAWLSARFSDAACARLEQYVALLRIAAAEQSLIARSTFDQIWARHIVDSAQLAAFGNHDWLDVGAGAGLPGIVLAIVTDLPVTMVEPRRKRATLLDDFVDRLGLSNCRVIAGRVQVVDGSYSTVTARAVASIEQLFDWTHHVVSCETRYVLPRGRSCEADILAAQHSYRGLFHVEQSLTDVEAGIAIAEQVTRI